jgi:HD-GYP domain-containing protein (c-di-GMP phosphodiesterase class II)
MGTAETIPLATVDISKAYNELLAVLGIALDFRDNETAGHSRRVVRYCLEIARAMGCTEEQREQISRGAYLHDLGKIAIPDAILFKKGKLDPQEWNVMRTHAWIGFNLISRITLLVPAAEILLTHHERFDGSGYPRGLQGDRIPLGARIFAVADTLDAMTSDRPYRKALSFAAAREEIIRQSGRQFDPEVVRAFLAIPEEKLRDVLFEEKRRTARVPFTSEALCRVGDHLYSLRCRNISEGGMLMESANGFSAGDELELQFALPERNLPLKPRVRVVRRELPNLVAVTFLSQSAEFADAIRSYVAARINV